MPRGKSSLSREQILAAALQLVDQAGTANLTMRTLADKLGVGTMSLYYHLPDKTALLDGVLEQTLNSIELLTAKADCCWVEQVRRFALGFRQVGLEHPNVLPLLLTRRFRSTGALRPFEAILRTLREAGFSTEDTLYAYRTLIGYTVGSIWADLTGPFTEPHDATRAEIAQRFMALPTSDFPHLSEIATYIAQTDAESEFRYGLELILKGLQARWHATHPNGS